MTFKNRISICLICCCLPFVSACQPAATKSTVESKTPKVQSNQPADTAHTPYRFAAIPARQTANSSIYADLNYQTTTMAGIAGVSDILVIGTFSDKNAAVETHGIVTTGTFHVQTWLFGSSDETIQVGMGGDTIPYRDIDQIYSPEELEKYQIDPNNPDHESYSMAFEGMPIFETETPYLVALRQEDGRYFLSPSYFNLCPLMPSDANVEAASLLTAAEAETLAAGEGEGLDGQIFSIDEYVNVFKTVHGA